MIPTYETTDVDLAAFLLLEGLKLIECVKRDSNKVTVRFFDEKNVARDLERVWLNSNLKNYNDFRKYLLREVHGALRS